MSPRRIEIGQENIFAYEHFEPGFSLARLAGEHFGPGFSLN